MSKFFFIISISFFFFGVVFSQKQSQHKLIEQLQLEKLSPQESIDKLDVLFYKNQYSDTVKANYFNNKMFEISKKNKISLGLAKYYYNKSVMDFFKENYKDVIKNSKRAQFYLLKQKVTDFYFFCVYNECLSLLNLGQFELAHKKAMKIINQYKYKYKTSGIGQLYLFLSETNLQKSNFKTAFLYSKKALVCFERSVDIPRISQCDVLMSDISFALGNYSESIKFLESIYKQFPELKNNQTYQIVVSYELAKSHIKNKDFKAAIRYANNAIYHLKEGNLKSKMYEMYLITADAYLNLGKIQLASELVKKKEKQILSLVDKEYSHKNIKYLNYIKSEIYKRKGDYLKALFYQKKNLELNKVDIETYLSISELESKLSHFDLAYFYLKKYNTKKVNEIVVNSENNINELDALYNVKVKEDIIQDLKIQELKKEIELKNQKEFSKNIVIFSIILIIIILFGIYIYRIRIKVSQILNYKNEKLESINELLNKSLREKELLLKEIHHRVKNNLQLVSSILNIQANDSPEISVTEFLDKCQNRISSIALIHQNLYVTENLDKVDFQIYIKDLSNCILASFSDKERIRYEIFANNNSFNIQTSISLGLIISELSCNAIKYAFQDNKEGIISVEINQLNNEKFEMVFGDNGCGEIIGDNSSVSIGLELVNLLTMQLNGEFIKLERRGTFYKITFEEIKN